MIASIIGIITALGPYSGSQGHDTVLALQPPVAKCAIVRNPLAEVPPCAGFSGPGWLIRNPLPVYPPLLVYAGAEYTADLTVLVDSLGAVARFEYRDSLVSRVAYGGQFFLTLLKTSIAKWRFVPAVRDGRAVPSVIRVVVLWSREECGSPDNPIQVQSTARVGVAALVVEVSACSPPSPPPRHFH